MASYAYEVLRDNPLVWWRLDESSGDALDSGSSGTTGVPGAAVTRGATSVTRDNGTSFTFAGGTATSVVNNIGFPAQSNGGAYSVEGWIRTSDAGAGARVLYGAIGTVGANTQGALKLVDNVPQFVASNTSSTPWAANAASTVNDGLPHHLVGVHQAGALTLYVDGGLAATTIITGTARGYTFCNAGNNSFGTEGYAGALDNLAYYSTALSATRISAHYAAGIAVQATDAFNATYGVETLGVVSGVQAREAAAGTEVLGVVPASPRNAAFGMEVLGSPIGATQAWVSALIAQTPINLDSTVIEARTSAISAQAALQLDSTLIEGRVSALLGQVALQLQYGYVTDFDGNPIMIWDGTTQRYVRVVS